MVVLDGTAKENSNANHTYLTAPFIFGRKAKSLQWKEFYDMYKAMEEMGSTLRG